MLYHVSAKHGDASVERGMPAMAIHEGDLSPHLLASDVNGDIANYLHYDNMSDVEDMDPEIMQCEADVEDADSIEGTTITPGNVDVSSVDMVRSLQSALCDRFSYFFTSL
jgi:hypothetical protein